MIRRTYFFAFVIALCAIAAAPPAHAATDWWAKLFGSKEEDAGPKPEDTLQAPFNDLPAGAQPAGGNGLSGLYTGPVKYNETAGLDQPHRQHQEISQWLIRATSEVLEIEADKYDDHLRHLSTGMDANALAAFQAFIQKSNLLQTLKANNLKLHCFVEEKPIMLNRGVVEGRYRWLFELPVMLTFLNRGTAGYDSDTKPINQHVIVRIQVGRVPKGKGTDEMMIESFDVRQNPSPKNPQ